MTRRSQKGAPRAHAAGRREREPCPSAKNLPSSKRGFYFTTDAVLAVLLLIVGLALISRFFVHETTTTHANARSRDLLNTLNEITLAEFDEPFVREEVNNGNITDLNKTVLLMVGEYWATNRTGKAETLAALLVDRLTPPTDGINISLGGDLIYLKNRTHEDAPVRDVIITKRMVSGIAKGAPLRGSSSAAYLKKIRDKRTASYAYFGGFEGQGNLTKYVDDIPLDVTPQHVVDITLELDVSHSFNLYLNNQGCGAFTPVQPPMASTFFNATSCKTAIVPGRNVFTFKFNGTLNESAISGGFLRIRYKTDEFHHNISYGINRYQFPGILGIINLYSSLYVPGTINSYKANATFLNNFTTFLTVGNETIFNVSGQNTTQNVYRERGSLNWPTSTIPVRLGILNINTLVNQTSGQPADIVFVSDVSGSMGDCVIWQVPPTWWCTYRCRQFQDSQYQNFACGRPNDWDCTDQNRPCGGVGWNRCRNFNENHVCNETKIDLLKRAENNSVDRFLNVSGVQVGLVSYSTATKDTLPLVNDKWTLWGRINAYSPDSYTCISCGILSARGLYPHLHKEYMILISDGDANRNTTGGSGNAASEAIAQGQAACAAGITVYTIGFGSDISQQGTQTLQQIACNTSLYYNATNVSELYDIVRNITEQIIILSNYSAQTLDIVGNFTMMNLSPDSYIEVNYTPAYTAVLPNEITVSFESPAFQNCSPMVDVPEGVRLIDAKLTSYSGPHWTDGVIVNSAEIFNLSTFNTNYYLVGDPFIVQIPTTNLHAGAVNTIQLRTGDTAQNFTNCSLNNSLIYLVGINSSTARTDVVERAEGCKWSIEFEDGTFLNTSIPGQYVGFNRCNYTNASIAYNTTDAYDLSVYNILRELDFDTDGRVFVNLNAEDLEIVVTLVSQIPYLWGPSFLQVVTWR